MSLTRDETADSAIRSGSKVTVVTDGSFSAYAGSSLAQTSRRPFSPGPEPGPGPGLGPGPELGSGWRGRGARRRPAPAGPAKAESKACPAVARARAIRRAPDSDARGNGAPEDLQAALTWFLADANGAGAELVVEDWNHS